MKNNNTKYNLGHKFETLMGQALTEQGITLKTKANAPYLSFNYKDLEVNKLLSRFVKKYITVGEFCIPTHIENKKSISADFYNKAQSISCKRNNFALKHPKLGAVLSILTDIQTKDLLPFDNIIVETRKDFVKRYKCQSKELYNSIAVAQFEALKKEQLNPKRVKELYDFLIGKEKPIIVKLDSSKKQLVILDTSKIKEANKLKYFLVENSNGRKQMVIEFDNGVSVQQRIKTATNSLNNKEWYLLFKEEWTLKYSPVILESLDIIN